LPESILSTDSFILILALLFIVGVLTTRFSTKLGVPSLILFFFSWDGNGKRRSGNYLF
jgi:potassium/hydrogen antiporter